LRASAKAADWRHLIISRHAPSKVKSRAKSKTAFCITLRCSRAC
jgi:hypothetical protein